MQAGRGVKFGVGHRTDDAPWVYCFYFKTKQRSTAWEYRDEQKPTKVARERNASNQMIVSFFNKTGRLATVALKNCRTVNSDCCNEEVRTGTGPAGAAVSTTPSAGGYDVNRSEQRTKLCRSELPAYDIMRKVDAPRPFLFYACFVINFTVA
ncbi:hypothetical protein EVAR_62489_1 [Eumeta japonica]|uniref:Uncharacterized protein n=1 Tax=Eumeta variegata TaxID=151549 RepID=A0A4C1ZKZ5_EUMVA|nr:hypothetical protein EVAR_62489_1 [Eumeta japonica]